MPGKFMSQTTTPDYEAAGPYYRMDGITLREIWPDPVLATINTIHGWAGNLTVKLQEAGQLDHKMQEIVENGTTVSQQARTYKGIFKMLVSALLFKLHKLTSLFSPPQERDDRAKKFVERHHFMMLSFKEWHDLDAEIRHQGPEKIIAYALRVLPEKAVIEAIPSYIAILILLRLLARSPLPGCRKEHCSICSGRP
jgi:hypothetical protein